MINSINSQLLPVDMPFRDIQLTTSELEMRAKLAFSLVVERFQRDSHTGYSPEELYSRTDDGVLCLSESAQKLYLEIIGEITPRL